MRKLIDLSNKRFGKWFVVGLEGRDKHGAVLWLCNCDCGNQRKVRGFDLRRGLSNDCGCTRNASARARAKHGLALDGVYNVYYAMLYRCFNPNDKNFRLYGGRGITVCDRWRGDTGFINFISDMGARPEGFTLERKNSDGNYEPGNCSWESATTNGRNTSRTKLSIDKAREIRALYGKGVTGVQLAKKFGTSTVNISDIVNNKIWKEEAY